MSLSPKSLRVIQRIIPYGVISFSFGIIYLLIEFGLLGDSTSYPSTGVPYNFAVNIITLPIASLLFGFLIGTIETLYISKYFGQRSLAVKIISKTTIYILSIIAFLLFTSLVGNSINADLSLLDPTLWKNTIIFLFNWAFWSVVIYIANIVIISLLYAEFTAYLGQDVTDNFFKGKYHRPIEEERIFMFLDMKSSTTFAEKLGHVRYFEMLQEYYIDLSDPIVDTRGLIYQYVGDEIVVSWDMKKGLSNNNCIRCFELMKEGLKEVSQKYEDKYGLIPTFKAGFHSGTVTTGEIGKIKKDITFTGDVLNTTARIQALCNSYGVDLILSESILTQLSSSLQARFKSLGKVELRGKNNTIELFALK